MLLVICCLLNAADKLVFVISTRVVNFIRGSVHFLIQYSPACVYLFLDHVQTLEDSGLVFKCDLFLM